MKRLFTIAVLTISLLALLAACGKEATPTATPGLAQPTAQDLKQAAQEPWETFSASANTRNAAPPTGFSSPISGSGAPSSRCRRPWQAVKEPSLT